MDGPKKIGRYGLHEPVGKSPVSVVYRGWDEAKTADVIVKVAVLRDERFGARFLRELERWKNVDVPGVAHIEEFGKLKGYGWYATSTIATQSVRQAIDEKIASKTQFSDKELLLFTRRLCGVVNQLHEKKVVHGNIKPSNVLLGEKGEVYLTDLGLARAQDAEEVNAWPEGFEVFRHLSPDQLLGLKPLDERSDIYQLALVLYEIITLTNPFAGADSAATLLELMKGPLDPPDQLRPGLDAKLSRPLMNCLQRERDTRPNSVRDFRQAWGGGTGKHEVVKDAAATAGPSTTGPLAALASGSASGGRPSGRSAAVRSSGKIALSSKSDPTMRIIKPVSRSAQVTGIIVMLAGILGGGYWIYNREANLHLEGSPVVDLGIESVRVSYRTNLPCATAVLLVGSGRKESFKNPKDGENRQHFVELTHLKLKTAYRMVLAMGEQQTSESFPVLLPGGRDITGLTIEPDQDKVAIKFKTTTKVRSHLEGATGGKTFSIEVATEPETNHEVKIAAATPGAIENLSIAITDTFGTKHTLAARTIAHDAIVQFSAVFDTPPLNGPVAGSEITHAFEKAGLASALEELSALTPWLFTSHDVSGEDRELFYGAMMKLELLLATTSGLPSEVTAVRTIRTSPYFRGQLLPAADVVALTPTLFTGIQPRPSTVLARLATFSKLRPGIMGSKNIRIAYDPKPQVDVLSAQTKAVLHFPAPPAGSYGSALLAIGISQLPKNGIVTAEFSQGPKALVLYSAAAGGVVATTGEIFISRRLSAREVMQGAADVTLTLKAGSNAASPDVRVIGGLLIFEST